MSEQAGFDVPAGARREPSAAERFARRQPAQPASDDDEGLDDLAIDRTIPLRAVLDAASMTLIVAGLTVGDITAWTAGGRVPGLSVLAGALITLGVLLGTGR